MDVPIVGEPASIMLWYPTSMIHCKCQPKAISIVVVTGFQNYAACGNCNRLYCIEAIRLVEGVPLVTIGMAMKTQTDKVN